MKLLVQPGVRLCVSLKVGEQRFVVPKEKGGVVRLEEWDMGLEKGVKTVFENGVEKGVSVLIDWLCLEGFEKVVWGTGEGEEEEEDGLCVVYYFTKNEDGTMGRNGVATLRWDESAGEWRIHKTQGEYKRMAIVAFVRPGGADFRLILTAKGEQSEGLEAFGRYLKRAQAAHGTAAERKRIEFKSGEGIVLDCVRYKKKVRYRTKTLKVSITTTRTAVFMNSANHSAENSQHDTTITNISVAHLFWKRLKNATAPAPTTADCIEWERRASIRQIGKIAEEASASLEGVVKFARRMVKVIGRGELWNTEDE